MDLTLRTGVLAVEFEAFGGWGDECSRSRSGKVHIRLPLLDFKRGGKRVYVFFVQFFQTGTVVFHGTSFPPGSIIAMFPMDVS